MSKHQRYLIHYLGTDAMTEVIPPTLAAEFEKAKRGEKAKKERVLAVHDEMRMGAFDAGTKVWEGNGVQVLPRKTQGPSVMVSEFLSEKVGPIVATPDVSEWLPDEACVEMRADYVKLNGSDDFSRHEDVRTRVTILPGKSREGYWQGEDVVIQTQKLFIHLFKATHPDCEAVIVYDNSSCHGLFAPDALVVARLNAGPGRSHKPMRKGWVIKSETVETGLGEFEIWTKEVKSMVFEENDMIFRDFSLPFTHRASDGKERKEILKWGKGNTVAAADAHMAKLIGLLKGAWQVRLVCGDGEGGGEGRREDSCMV